MRKQRKGPKPVRFADVQQLQQRIAAQAPASGEYFYDYKLEEARQEEAMGDEEAFHAKFKVNFSDLPVSAGTLRGLNGRGFSKMTEVQRCSIPHAMAGRDVLVSSRTGSGKTLAYLVPLVEKLYRNRFIPVDGLGALVIVPVRQLAIQVFEVLNSFSEKLEMSVGLVIGGKDIRHEKDQLHLMNVLVATPGRLLQHLEGTYGFQTSNLQMLVLDEADVMMEMGFKESLRMIMQSLPRCQTLMFSATITKDIYALASICTDEPEKILLQGVSSRHAATPSSTVAGSAYQTPAKLMQYYMVVPPEDKINTFYSFLKTHSKQKIIVFVSTCKQVRFLYESFRKFRLGTPLYQLQGHQKQKKRMAIYFTFCEKKHGVLLCTNIAARGLDFPMVDWVVQLDIPDDPDIYVHRAGRTARYKAEGKALMLVSEHERPLVETLKGKGVSLHKISQNPQRYLRVQSSLQSICSEHQDVKYLAQRALISYLKFVYKAHNKEVFSIRKLDLQKLAHSFGLLSAPSINIKGQQAGSDDEQGQEQDDKPKLSKIEMMRMKQKQKKMEVRQKKMEAQKQAEEQQEEEEEEQEPVENEQNEQQSDGELFRTKQVVRSNHQKVPLTTSKRQLKKIKSEGHFDGRNKIHFDDDLNPISNQDYRRIKRLEANQVQTNENRLQKFQTRVDENRQQDDVAEKKRRQDKRRKKEVQRQFRRRGGQAGGQAVLAYSQEEFDEQ